MAREKFVKIVSSAVPVNVENIDTDQIIPARFLKATERKGFGDNLFRDWRYTKDNQLIPDFPVNDKTKYEGNILVAGYNFGCGSSREHAAWAIYDYGFRVVVSRFCVDICRTNGMNNGLLPIQVTPEFLAEIFATISKDNKAQFTVDLAAQTITNNATGKSESFAVDGYKKECLLNGYDDVDYLVTLRPEVATYEQAR